MKPADNLLFAKITSLPVIDKEKAANEILELDVNNSFWDEYRHTRMFPLMTKEGKSGKTGTLNCRDGEFEWTSFAPPTVKNWCEDYVFPWLGMKTRVMALITQPGIANFEHFDCSPLELNTLQHKFRIILRGKSSTLYWLTDQGKVYAPDIEEAFIMDGGWPHGMVNSTNDVKVTIALGSPWNGKDNYRNDIKLLQNRYEYNMPHNISHLWHKKYS